MAADLNFILSVLMTSHHPSSPHSLLTFLTIVTTFLNFQLSQNSSLGIMPFLTNTILPGERRTRPAGYTENGDILICKHRPTYTLWHLLFKIFSLLQGQSKSLMD